MRISTNKSLADCLPCLNIKQQKDGKAKTQAQPVSTLDHFLIDVVAGSQDNFALVKRWQRITPPVQYSQ
jgi:hypothetical protein